MTTICKDGQQINCPFFNLDGTCGLFPDSDVVIRLRAGQATQMDMESLAVECSEKWKPERRLVFLPIGEGEPPTPSAIRKREMRKRKREGSR